MFVWPKPGARISVRVLRTAGSSHRYNCGVQLSGVSAPLPAIYDESAPLRQSRMRATLGRWVQIPLSGFVVLGTNGEFGLLDEDRSDRVSPPTVGSPARHPNIVGMKESGSDLAKTSELVTAPPAGVADRAGQCARPISTRDGVPGFKAALSPLRPIDDAARAELAIALAAFEEVHA